MNRELSDLATAMYVTVSLVKNSRIALPWTMFNASSDHTFAKLFEDVELHIGSGSTSADSASASCSISAVKECLPSQRVAVDLSFNVIECCTLNGRFIRYEQVAVQQENPPDRMWWYYIPRES